MTKEEFIELKKLWYTKAGHVMSEASEQHIIGQAILRPNPKLHKFLQRCLDKTANLNKTTVIHRRSGDKLYKTTIKVPTGSKNIRMRDIDITILLLYTEGVKAADIRQIIRNELTTKSICNRIEYLTKALGLR